MADRPRRRRPGGRRWLVIVGIVVVLVGGAVGAWAATRPSGPSYRTATAGPAEVTDTMPLTGTIEPVSEATVGFPVAGQVRTVAVQQGQQVSAGQTLAQLDSTSLASQVSSAQSQVATQQAKLAADETSQTGGTAAPPSSGGSSGSASGSMAGLTAGQNAVRRSQQQVDTDLTLVGAAIKQENATCPPAIQQLVQAGQQPPPTTSTPPTTGPTTSSPMSPSSSPGGSSLAQQVTQCANLMQQVLDDQARTSTDEHGLAGAESALNSQLAKAAASLNQAAGSGASGRAGGSGSGQGRGGQPVTADQLAADQAAVDAANAQLAAVQQSMAAETLVSPISGTVAEVDLTPGESVSAGSGSAHIIVIGPGASEVTTAVSDTQVGQVKPGQTATITPDGSSTPLTGTVTAIGALASTTSSGSASYPVTITLNTTGQQLYAGATASLNIDLGSAAAAVTVPTSAVHSVGAFSFVELLDNGKATPTRVTLGIRGATVTQVTSGLTAGQQVVLADYGQALPSSNTTSAGGMARRLGGGFGGGGGGGGAGGVRVGGGGGKGGGKGGG